MGCIHGVFLLKIGPGLLEEYMTLECALVITFLSEMTIDYNFFLFWIWYLLYLMRVVFLDAKDHRLLQRWQNVSLVMSLGVLGKSFLEGCSEGFLLRRGWCA